MDRFGKVLIFDGERLSFRLLRSILGDEAVYFSPRTGNLFHKGRECYLDEAGGRFIIGDLPNDDIVFETASSFLHIYSYGILFAADAEGTIRLTHQKILEARFFLVPENTFTLLAHFFQNGLTYAGETERREVKVHDFVIDDGENRFSLEANIKVSLHDERIVLLTEEVFLIEIEKYRPLVYFCAFGGEGYLETLFTSIRSYMMFSKANLNFLIFTNIYDVDLPPDLKYAPVRIIRMPSVAMNSRYYKRYSPEIAEYFREYSPIVYSDADIICNNDITDMLRTVHASNRFFIACECGRRTKDFVLRSGWFIGSFLLRDKSLSEDDVRPVNSGFFAFRSFQEFSFISQAMQMIAHNIIKLEGFNNNVLDQSSLNYLLIKFCEYDCFYLNDIVITWPDSDFSKIARAGIVHFCGHGNLIGNFETKEEGVKAYFDYVQSVVKAEQQQAIPAEAEKEEEVLVMVQDTSLNSGKAMCSS